MSDECCGYTEFMPGSKACKGCPTKVTATSLSYLLKDAWTLESKGGKPYTWGGDRVKASSVFVEEEW